MACLAATAAEAAELPPSFVYLADIDASIRQDIRYAGASNFTGAVVPGYRAAECILASAAAGALAKVQADLARDGYGLLVWDCYRPQKAVDRFVSWAASSSAGDRVYHPRVRRDRLIAEGYLARRSGHSSGSAVDLTLTRDGKPVPMGTGFDFFDPLAATHARGIPPEAAANRRRLVTAMERRGFRNYRREWWHFHYLREPSAGRAMDFDILPRR